MSTNGLQRKFSYEWTAEDMQSHNAMMLRANQQAFEAEILANQLPSQHAPQNRPPTPHPRNRGEPIRTSVIHNLDPLLTGRRTSHLDSRDCTPSLSRRSSATPTNTISSRSSPRPRSSTTSYSSASTSSSRPSSLQWPSRAKIENNMLNGMKLRKMAKRYLV